MAFSNHCLLIPQDLEQRKYKGYITINGREYKVALTLGDSGTFKGGLFACDGNLADILRCYKEPMLEKLKNCITIQEFLSEIEAAVESVAAFNGDNGNTDKWNLHFIENIVNDLETFGWSKVLSVSIDFTCIKLKHKDSFGEEHTLSVQFDISNPNTKPQITADVPLAMKLKWPAKGMNTVEWIYSQFLDHLACFEDFWTVLREIDKKCWVLEPEKPSKSINYRRIVVNNNTSLLLSINPVYPREFPDCKFVGPEYSVKPLKERLYAALQTWDTSETVFSNLEVLLDIEFPVRGNSTCEEYSMNCGICYSYTLDNEVPDKNCEHPKCGKVYHKTCLLEWLKSLPHFKQSFNVIFGECPNCSATFTVKV